MSSPLGDVEEGRAEGQLAHDSERHFAELLDFYGVRWEYEPVEFVLEWHPDGSPAAAFRPDFYLPDHGCFVELTTLNQRLVTRKNAKVRRLRQLHPRIEVKLLYQRDYLALVAKYRFGPLGRLPPNLGGVTEVGPDSAAASDDDELRHSPLEAAHLDLGAKLVGFGGWLMPLAYSTGTLVEHRQCRTEAVCFDVSHLGTVRVEGAGAQERLQRALSNDLGKVRPGRAQYTHLLDEADGSVVDDIIVWWVGDDVFDVMPNASNTSRVLEAIGGTDTTSGRAVVAVQGPRAALMLSQVAPEAAGVARFGVTTFTWGGAQCTAAGTGYTGEDGVECALPVDVARPFWDAVVGAGVAPAGLGARDTLRLEAGLPLHGHELGPGITPLQAGLGWVVGWAKGPFRGRAALEAERDAGVARHLRGFVADGRQPPRQDAPLVRGEHAPTGASDRAGVVTSGNFSPTLERGIAMALVDTSSGLGPGDRAAAVVRDRLVEGTLVAMPFVRDGHRAVSLGQPARGASS